MYPLSVVLVGVDEAISLALRRDLAHVTAEVENEFDSASTAIESLRQFRKQPQLIIVQIDDDYHVDEIRRLGDGLFGWPILALMSGGARDDFLRVNRAGAVQIVSLPLDRDDFHHALNNIALQFAKKTHDRQVFAVTGAAGGSGATTIAVNLAYEIAARFERSTIIAEFTQQMGALASMFDVQPRMTIPQLLREIHRVDDFLLEKALVKVGDHLRILAGPDALQSRQAVEPGHLVKIVGCLKKLADVTILDMPGTFDDLEFQVLRACDHVIIVATQNVPAMRSLKLFCESLPPERVMHSLRIVLNRYNPGLKGFTRDDVKQMLGVPHVLSVANDYHAVNLAVNKGCPLRQIAPNTAILRDLDVLIHEIIDLEDAHAESNGHGFLNRMFRALKG
jgi:Flp pilus assembly CpaE family ATPase